MPSVRLRVALGALVPVALLAACGDDTSTVADTPTIVVTTTMLGDVVGELVGPDAEVVTLMPVGADPHDFAPSARDAAVLREADLVVANGGGLEEGLLDVLAAAESDGVPVHEAIEPVDGLGPATDGDDDGDDHGGDVDPHFFTDPARMAVAAQGIAAEMEAAVPALATPELRDRVDAYVAELEDLDAEVAEVLGAVAPEDRVLVTNHDSLAYLADRYGYEVIGTVIPATTTTAAAAPGELADLAATMERAGVRAVFAETTSPDDVARALAEEVGDDVEVVELWTGSLGPADSDGATYISMIRSDAGRIAGALADGGDR